MSNHDIDAQIIALSEQPASPAREMQLQALYRQRSEGQLADMLARYPHVKRAADEAAEAAYHKQRELNAVQRKIIQLQAELGQSGEVVSIVHV